MVEAKLEGEGLHDQSLTDGLSGDAAGRSAGYLCCKLPACQDREKPGKLGRVSYRFEACSDSLCGALFCKTSTRLRPVAGTLVFSPLTISFALMA
jgi:hypothetical protein